MIKLTDAAKELCEQPANPTVYMDQSNGSGEMFCDSIGLTKREHFMLAALNGLLSNSSGLIQANSMSGFGYCNCDAESISKMALELAHSALNELAK